MTTTHTTNTSATEAPVSSTTTTSTSARNQAITRRAEAGEDLTAIGKDYAMSRERARQIVAKTTTMSNEDIRQARQRRRDADRAQAENLKAQQIREIADQHPQATLNTLVTLTGHPLATVRDALDWTERERRCDSQNYTSVPEAEVLAEIRRVANLPAGSPLTGAFYEQHRNDGVGVSHARLLQRYGTWTAACEAAGVPATGPNPTRTYARNWTEEVMVELVWVYLSNHTGGTYAGFEAWLRTQDGTPSAQTVRNSIGSWVQMKRRAIETHAG